MKIVRFRIKVLVAVTIALLVVVSHLSYASDGNFELEKGRPFPAVKFQDRQKNLVDVCSNSSTQNQLIVFTVSADKKNPELLDLINKITSSDANITSTVVFLDQNFESGPLASHLDAYPNIRFLFDRSQSAVKQFQIYITPMIYLVDNKGALFNLIVGYSFFTPQVLVSSTEKLTQKNLDFLLKRPGAKD